MVVAPTYDISANELRSARHRKETEKWTLPTESWAYDEERRLRRLVANNLDRSAYGDSPTTGRDRIGTAPLPPYTRSSFILGDGLMRLRSDVGVRGWPRQFIKPWSVISRRMHGVDRSDRRSSRYHARAAEAKA